MMARFEREVDPDGTLDPETRARMVESARSAHYARIAAKRWRNARNRAA
jgi:hypothetical protein